MTEYVVTFDRIGRHGGRDGSAAPGPLPASVIARAADTASTHAVPVERPWWVYEEAADA